MLNKEDEEYKKRLERARLLRNSVGMTTENDISNNTTSVQYDNEFQERLNRAKQIRNSVGMITDYDIESKETNVDDFDNTVFDEDLQKANTDRTVVEETDNTSEITSKKDITNVLLNNRKPESMMTEEEKIQQLAEQEQSKELNSQKDNDKNPFSQLGKVIENTWLGITSNMKAGVNYLTDAQHTKQQENVLLANNKNLATQIHKDELNNGTNIISNAQNKNLGLGRNLEGLKNNNNLSWTNNNNKNNFNTPYNDEIQNKLTNELNSYRDAYGDIELSSIQRELSKSIVNDQNKISMNSYQIENPIVKKVSQIAPSAANSFFGAGLSMVNPYLGISYFMITASGMYEADGRSRGMTRDEARAYGTIMGYMEGVTEQLEMSRWLKAGSSLRSGKIINALKTYGIDMLDNFAQEAIIDPIDELVSYKTSGKTKHDYSTKEGWEELAKDMIQDGIDGALSSLLMSGIDIGLNTPIMLYNKIQRGNTVTNQDIINAYTEINNESQIDIEQHFKDSIEYQISKFQNGDVNKYSFIDINDDNTINLKEVIGTPIKLINNDFNIAPVVIYNDGYYNVIDANSKIKLDTNNYNTMEEAKNGFNTLIKNADKATINNVNNQVLKAQFELNKKMSEIQNTAIENPDILTKGNRINFVDDEKLYSREEAESILDKFDIEHNLNNRPYLGQELNYTIMNELFNKDTLGNINRSTTDFNQDKNTDNLDAKTTYYTTDNVKNITDQFKTQTEYTKNEMANIWNNEVDKNDLNVIYDDNGKINSYIAIEEDSNNLKIIQYDNNDNIVQSETIMPQNGKFTSDSINNAIKKVTGVYEQNNEYKTTAKRTFEKEIELHKTKSKENNKVNGNVLEINTNIYDGISKKKQSSFLNEYLKNEVKGHDYYVDGEKLIANSTTIGKLKNGNTNFDKRIDASIRNELKANVISNLNNIVSTSKLYQTNRPDTKEHSFADTFDRRKSYFKYKGNNYEVMFSIGKKKSLNTLYSIDNIKKIGNITSGISQKETSKTPNKVDRSNVPKQSIAQKEKPVKSNSQNTNIQDFGEKIGGARKDLSMPRTNTKTGKEVIHDYTVQNTDNGYSVNFKNKILKDGFKTQQEAEQYILDFKNSIKDNRAFIREGTNRDGEASYMIFLRNPRTLKSQSIGKVFKNKSEAESYAMALSMYLKDNGKNLFRPQIQKVDRENANIKNATKTTGDDILKNFGFKGGEFGNWVTQKERQQFLNYAQDAFTDLAAALDVTPDSLGQQKAMSIAFGARGKGLTGAVAHFEPGKKVINMTRIKGAGSLAHEYGHSIDNYLSRVGGYNEDGMATENYRNPKLSDNMKNAIKEVTDAMKYNISTNQEEVDKKNAIYEKARKENLEYNLRYIDKVFNGDAHNYRRIKGKYEEVPIKVTSKQKSDYQKIRNTLMEGGLKGDIDYKMTDTRSLKAEKIYPEPINTLQKMYKEVVGRKIDDDTVYSLYRQGKPTRQVTEVKSETAYSKSALELDKATGRTTAYFSRIDEMWARAFESYISDKLKAKGITDTYLVHSVNNNEYALFNPFPAGEERKNINKAFDNLIQIMKDEGLFTSSGTPQNVDNDTGIRYMKKNTTVAKIGNIMYNDKGIQLGKKEYQILTNAINTDTPNLQKGINYKHYGDYFYIFDKLDFNNYNIQGKIKIINNEKIINKIMKEVDDNDRTTRSIDRLLEISKNGKGLHSSNNINVRNTGGTTTNGGLSSRAIQKNGKTSRGTTTNFEKSNSNNRARIENGNDIRFAKRTAKEIDNTKRNAERGESYIEQEIQKIEKTGNWDDSIPITKLTDIRKTIEDYLGLGVKKGHFRQDAYGIYKTNRDVIRTKEYKDIDTILHETGHAMDLGNRLNVDKESIADELFAAIDKLGGYEQESRTVRLEEGFAEVIREYSIVPEQAKVDYPQTIAVLEGLKKTDKKFNNFITKVQQQSYNYIHQNPRNRTLSNVSIGEQTDKQKITKNLIKQEVMRNIYDRDYVVKSAVNELAKANGKTANQIKASENAYYLTRLASGKTDKVISMLSDGYIDEHGKKLMPGLNGIGDILGNDTQRWNDLRAYLVAQRDLEYKAKTLKTGIRTMDSKAVVEQFKNDKQIQQASKLVYDTLNGVMQYAVNNGLITQEGANKLKQSNAFYVPMHRVLNNRGNQVGRKGAVADLIQKRTGSELDVKDVLENIIANSSNMIQQVENNNILRALYKEGQTTGLTGAIYDVIDTPMTKIGTAQLSTWESELKKQGVNTKDLDLEKTIDLFAPNKKVDAQNLITSFIDDNGKRIYLQFNDEVLFNSLMNMDKKFMSQVLKINSKLNMPLRYGATMANLGFAIPNMISDTAQAAVYSTAGFIPVVDNALGVLDILSATSKTVRNFVNSVAPEYAERINKLYALYQQSGATNSTRLSQFRESTQNLMQDVYGTKSKNLSIKEKYKPLKRLLDILTYIPEISEQSTRFRVFEKNYEYYKNKGTAEMDSRILAALESRDSTQDFGRTGNITREINQIIPFSAARVGSSYTFTEKLKANPKQVGMRIAILTAIAMGIKAMGYDDDEIDELNQRKKDDNFVMRVGDDIVTIKKPQGILRSIVNLAEYIQDLATDHIEEGKEGKRLAQWLNNAIMDNMPADEVTGLVPNAVAPLIENAINKDFYYNTDIVKSYDQDLPDSEQYYDYNSQLAIWLGKIFNYSPAKIDNLISGYFGGLGTSITDTMDYALGKMGVIPEQPEMGAEDNAIAKRFIVNVNSNSSSIDEIYNRKTELTKLQNGGTISAEEEKELEKIKSAISNLADLNKQIKEIKKDLTMSGTEKADKIKILQQEKTDTARQALGKDLIHEENESKIQSTQFYPDNILKKSGYSLTLNSEQKKEFEQYAYEFYSKYEKQGLYSEDKLKEIKTKSKEYAKNQMFQKYRTNLVKTK